MPEPTPARLLSAQFFRRLLDNDLVSPQHDGRQNLGVVFGLLASPGILVTTLLLFIYFNPLSGPAQRLIFSLPDKFLLIAAPMLLMALVTTVQWDALALDARDLAILGPLPLGRGVLITAKLASLAYFVLCFAVAVNVVPTVIFPSLVFASLSMGFGRVLVLTATHGLVSLAATTFAFVAVLAAREVLRAVLGFRLFRRLNTALQFMQVLGLFTALLLAPVLAPSVGQLLASSGVAVYLCPPAWFLGLYETLAGPVVLGAPGLDRPQTFELWTAAANNHARVAYESLVPAFHHLALLAVLGLVVATFIGIGGHLVHAGDATRMIPARRRHRTKIGTLVKDLVGRTVVRNPASQVGFFFTLQTLARSPVHRLYVAGYLAAGVAVSILLVASTSARGGLKPGAPLSISLLALPMVLSFLLIIGLRQAFAVPAELRANWVFQMYAGAQVRHYIAGARRAVLLVLVAPGIAAFVPLSALLWGAWTAAVHFAAVLLTSWIVLEFALMRTRNLPFTCSHVPGSANLKTWWPVYAASFAASTLGFASIERLALASREASAALVFALLMALLTTISVRRIIEARNHTELTFEETPDDATQELGLQALW